MSIMKINSASSSSTSTGHSFSEGNYLDSHYASSQPEYEAMLKSVDLKPSWRVLDAGCGSGSFHPLMSQILGKGGHIDALDLAPENISIVNSRAAAGNLACSVSGHVGPITDLNFADDTFDAVWCSAVTQYLTDAELKQTLAEFCRVVRPGGMVAVKDWDHPSFVLSSPGSMVLNRLYQAMVKGGDLRFPQMFRDTELPAWLRNAGLIDVKGKTYLVERYQPLPNATIDFLKTVLPVYSERAKAFGVPKADIALWEKVGQVDGPNSVLDDPDFYFREGHMLAIGHLPKN